MTEQYDVAAIMGGLYGDGIIGSERRLQPRVCRHALRRHDGAVRGGAPDPGRRFAAGSRALVRRTSRSASDGFVEIATHPWFVAVCEAVLTKDYRIVEFGFDIPFPGAADQPWHRDFKAPEATLTRRRLNSLAFNLTAVDTRPEHGPVEIALGTQWDDIPEARDDMFPDKSLWDRYVSRAVQKLPQRGDISARSALTIHRGTANRSNEARPVLVVAADAPDVHQRQSSRSAGDAGLFRRPAGAGPRSSDVPGDEQAGPIIQHHVIEGLLEADYG